MRILRNLINVVYVIVNALYGLVEPILDMGWKNRILGVNIEKDLAHLNRKKLCEKIDLELLENSDGTKVIYTGFYSIPSTAKLRLVCQLKRNRGRQYGKNI
tara:strand:+ start:428 stop:730 length:303 start_codon:yes stop_codon:yes gene_type:complete